MLTRIARAGLTARSKSSGASRCLFFTLDFAEINIHPAAYRAKNRRRRDRLAETYERVHYIEYPLCLRDKRIVAATQGRAATSIRSLTLQH